MSKERIAVKLAPKSSKNDVLGWETDLFGEKTLKCAVTAIPEKGKANKSLITLLSAHFDVPKSAIMIVRGDKSRLKIIEIQGLKDN